MSFAQTLRRLDREEAARDLSPHELAEIDRIWRCIYAGWDPHPDDHSKPDPAPPAPAAPVEAKEHQDFHEPTAPPDPSQAKERRGEAPAVIVTASHGRKTAPPEGARGAYGRHRAKSLRGEP